MNYYVDFIIFKRGLSLMGYLKLKKKIIEMELYLFKEFMKNIFFL